MSTRSQITFDGIKSNIYRHSDGYPGSIEKNKIGVIPDIMPFCLEFIKARGYDPEYLIACLTAYLRQWHCGKPCIDQENETSRTYHVIDVNGIQMRVLSLGIDTELHGDIEYLYEMSESGIKVTHRNWTRENGDDWKPDGEYKFDDYVMMEGKCISKGQLALAKKKNKISLKDKRLLVEAWRRYHMFEAGTTKNPYLGLGTPSEYKKSMFFKAVDEITPRVKNWWQLTSDGCVAFETLRKQLEWDKEYSEKIFNGWMPAFNWKEVSDKIVEKRFVTA